MAGNHVTPILMFRSRLMADMTIPPKKPKNAIRNALAPVCHGVKGIGMMQHNEAPSAVLEANPPARPAIVLDGEMDGNMARRPNSLPRHIA
jgi:hypothetical protein